ncbi:peroxidase family protein [Solirubrobacter soli]|uniref:peroxidase family protein n=1 Tax=Solirubrobacter soli TaxID=363832 RepID=UPI00041AD76E|nr:peroxidase family protein [Solirubrobacter soli]
MRAAVVGAAAAAVLVLSAGPSRAEERSLDGSSNNLAHPSWGQVGRPYARVTPAVYADGIAKPLAGPPSRALSNRVFNDTHQNLFSENGVTQWGFVWGQFMDHTFGLREETGGEAAPIAFDAHDPLETFRNDFGAIDFTRTPAAPATGTTGVPREQVNTVSSYIDGWTVYGGTPERLEWLREGPVNGDLRDNGAHLLLDPGGLLPRRSSRGDTAAAPTMALQGRLAGTPAKAMVAGDVRANENMALAATHTLFAREHNRIVDALPASLSEQRKFDIARRVVGAEQQVITYEEFLPALGVKLAPYRGYDPTVDATLTNEFATTGYRAHSMVHGEIEPSVPAGTYSADELDAFEDEGVEVEQDEDGVELAIPLNLTFANPDLLARVGIGPVLAAAGNESEYRNDEMIDNQLRSVLFQVPFSPGACLDGPPLPDCFNGVVDLGAIDVERGRDHGIPRYDDLRRAYGLAPKASFTAITGEATDAFPQGLGIDDPASLEFTELRDIHGDPLPLGDEANAVSGTRRTTLAARLKAIFGSVDQVDAFTGMLSERHLPHAEFGELQLAIWKRQFEALRDGDRFFYLADPELAAIEREYGVTAHRTLGQIIADNTGIATRADVFKLADAPVHLEQGGTASASVPPVLSLALGAPATFGPFTPGVARDYVATTTATVTSTAGDATLGAGDPGHLTNGSAALVSPLVVGFSRAAWTAPTSNDAVTMSFTQHIGATEALRTGAYSKTVLFTLSTTTP